MTTKVEIHTTTQPESQTYDLLGIQDFDDWHYIEEPTSGIGIVVNFFQDLSCTPTSGPVINLYIVPKDKAQKNDWNSDKEDLAYIVGTPDGVEPRCTCCGKPTNQDQEVKA